MLSSDALIGGGWMPATGGRWVAVTDPATGEIIARIPDLGTAETRMAITAAEAAWPARGREGSKLGIEEYLEIKAFHIGGMVCNA